MDVHIASHRNHITKEKTHNAIVIVRNDHNTTITDHNGQHTLCELTTGVYYQYTTLNEQMHAFVIVTEF